MFLGMNHIIPEDKLVHVIRLRYGSDDLQELSDVYNSEKLKSIIESHCSFQTVYLSDGKTKLLYFLLSTLPKLNYF